MNLVNLAQQLNSRDRDGRSLESLEAEHRTDAEFHASVVLLDPIVQILGGPKLQALGQLPVRLHLAHRSVRCGVAIFAFPPGEVRMPMPSATGPLEGVAVPLPDFLKLTRIPIVVYYGDNIPEAPSANLGEDNWRVRLAMARQ